MAVDADVERLVVLDQGHEIAFSFVDLIRYHGHGSPGGVAHAFKVLQRALPLLGADGPPERREIEVGTAFGGPGARDAFEFALRAVTGGRYLVDPSLERSDVPWTRARFVFRLEHRGRVVRATLCDGFVTEEFLSLARQDHRSPEEESRLDRLKLEMAERVMASPAEDVYDAEVSG